MEYQFIMELRMLDMREATLVCIDPSSGNVVAHLMVERDVWESVGTHKVLVRMNFEPIPPDQ